MGSYLRHFTLTSNTSGTRHPLCPKGHTSLEGVNSATENFRFRIPDGFVVFVDRCQPKGLALTDLRQRLLILSRQFCEVLQPQILDLLQHLLTKGWESHFPSASQNTSGLMSSSMVNCGILSPSRAI